jgi:hypothetical protein
MKGRLLFETMDATEADMVVWALNEVNIPHQVTGRSTVTAMQAVLIRIYVAEEDYEEAHKICLERELYKPKKAMRILSRAEKMWLYFLVSITPFLIILNQFIKAKVPFMLITLCYALLGYFLYKNYKAKK